MVPLVKVGLPDKNILLPAIEKVLYSGMIGEGESVYEFEERFQTKFCLENCLAFSSGTAALHTALIMAGVRPNDEVITTSMTAEPTNIAILQAGAVPVFADVDVTSGNISPESIAELITSKTKAILLVHYAGIPVRLHDVMSIAKEAKVPVIEDCAHALGAMYDGKSVGSYGDFAIFSFQAIKHMTTIDGGVLCIKDSCLVPKAKKFRWFGLEKGVARERVDITDLGYKYNMHNVAAAIGLVQLEGIMEKIGVHQSNGKYFDREIGNISGLSVPTFDTGASPSYWLYTIFSDDVLAIEKKLKEINVMASKLHRPNHLHTVFEAHRRPLPDLETYYKRMIHIPCGWWLTESVREAIVHALSRG